MATPLLDIQVRAKHYGERTVLDDIRLQLATGEIASLVGASGCGKSTLLRIAAGLDRDYRGSVRLDGEPLTEPTRDIGFVFQEPRLFPWLTVAENVGFDQGAGRDGARVSALLAEVGLAGYEAALPKQLSGGQAQRVALARGLYARPRVLLMDEPFSAVDAFTRIKLQDLLADVVQHHGVTVLLVTHDIDEAVVLSDRVLVLDANPGTLREDLPVALPRPRRRDDDGVAAVRLRAFHALQAVHAV
jgi:sulfonate transport system ATP-binding protein